MKRALILLLPSLLLAQTTFEDEGFVEYRAFAFPETTYTDSAHFIGEALIRYDVKYGLSPGLKLIGGTETRSDTHRQAEREFRLNWNDRGIKRPNFSIRHLSLQYTTGGITLEAGKQIIRWGKAGIVSPLDRFAPRDFLTVVDNDVLGVTAARVVFEGATDKLDVIAQPFFAPSRMPLLNQRWTVLPESIHGLPTIDRQHAIPGRTQWGARWTHTADGYDFSLSLFDGHNHQPQLRTNASADPVEIQRHFPALRMYGADFSAPVGWLRVRSEAAYFAPRDDKGDKYMLYVVQLERETPKWSAVLGYAGEALDTKRTQFSFAPDRGFSRAFVGRSRYELNARKSFSVETAVRQNGRGLWMRSEYTERWGPHWSGKVGFTFLRGEPADFLGQYRRNSFFNLSLRYSFRS